MSCALASATCLGGTAKALNLAIIRLRRMCDHTCESSCTASSCCTHVSWLSKRILLQRTSPIEPVAVSCACRDFCAPPSAAVVTASCVTRFLAYLVQTHPCSHAALHGAGIDGWAIAIDGCWLACQRSILTRTSSCLPDCARGTPVRLLLLKN